MRHVFAYFALIEREILAFFGTEIFACFAKVAAEIDFLTFDFKADVVVAGTVAVVGEVVATAVS
jgi:hypothetical protein